MKQYIVLTLLSTTVFSETDYDENSCAYATTGGIVASPLGYCSAYYQMATNGRSFSYDFTHDEESDKLNWNYYSDMDCQTLAYTAFPMDSDEASEGAIATQLIGSGDNCETVEITKTGSYSPYSDECSVTEETADDYFTSTYVVNECVGASINGQEASSILMCDDKGVYFNYYAGCTDCSCKMQQYAHYYDDGNGDDDDAEDVDTCHQMVCHTKKKRVHLRKNVISVSKANLPLFFKQNGAVELAMQNESGNVMEMSIYYIVAIAFMATFVVVGLVKYIYDRKKNKEEYIAV